jgi:hypothetical protein
VVQSGFPGSEPIALVQVRLGLLFVFTEVREAPFPLLGGVRGEGQPWVHPTQHVTGGVLVFGFSWFFIRTQLFDPQNSLRNVHVEALRIILDHSLCGSPYATRNNMENPHANRFG